MTMVRTGYFMAAISFLTVSPANASTLPAPENCEVSESHLKDFQLATQSLHKALSDLDSQVDSLVEGMMGDKSEILNSEIPNAVARTLQSVDSAQTSRPPNSDDIARLLGQVKEATNGVKRSFDRLLEAYKNGGDSYDLQPIMNFRRAALDAFVGIQAIMIQRGLAKDKSGQCRSKASTAAEKPSQAEPAVKLNPLKPTEAGAKRAK
jgi:hypothetical protein